MKKAIKLTAIILALLMAFSNTAFAASLPLATSQPQAKMANGLGDVSGDGKISILDSAFVFFHIIGIRKLDEATTAAADVNGDGKITLNDMREITQYSFNRISVFTADYSYWVSCDATSHNHSSTITTFEDYELKQDENGNILYPYTEYIKNNNLINATALSSKISIIEKSGNPNENIAMDLNLAFKLNAESNAEEAAVELTIRQFQAFDILNGFKVKIIDENGNATLVLPQINSYITGLEEYLPSTGSLTSVFDRFKNLDIEKEYAYAQDYYSHSHYIVRGGVEYICEVFSEPSSITNSYYTMDGNLVRMESFSRYSDNCTIMNIEHLKAEVDESLFDIPALYIKISFEELAAFISANSATQAYFDYLEKELN